MFNYKEKENGNNQNNLLTNFNAKSFILTISVD